MRITFSCRLLALWCFCSTASAITTGVDWTSTTSGDLDGVAVTMSNLTASSQSTFNLTGSDYSGAPLSTTTETLSYNTASNWTASFSESISDLLLYGVFWRGTFGGTDPVVYTFDQAFTILSGFGSATVSGGNTVLSLPDIDFHDGILQFMGPVTSLSVTSSTVCGGDCSFQALTFGVDTSAVPIPSAVWLFGSGLLGLVGMARRKKAS